jgi:hypothetical protein
MKLKSDAGNSFELAVLGYEHPDITEDRWDSNWLVVSGKVTAGDQSWRFVEPCVTTFELAELAEWLEDLGWRDAPDCAFTEPNLLFQYSPRPEPVVRIRFAHESAPPWMTQDPERIAGLTLDFPMSKQQAADLAAEVRNALVEYPERGGAA